MPYTPNKNGAAARGAPPPASALKIDRGIPLPVGSRHSRWADVLAQMQSGDSILFDNEKEATRCYQALHKLVGKAAKRKVQGGWRVWRLK